MNPENLVDLRQRTPEDRARISALGGKASGEAKRKKKNLREELQALLDSGSTQEKICIALINAALGGSAAAFKQIKDTVDPARLDIDMAVTARRYIEPQDLDRLSRDERQMLLELSLKGADIPLSIDSKRRLFREDMENYEQTKGTDTDESPAPRGVV